MNDISRIKGILQLSVLVLAVMQSRRGLADSNAMTARTNYESGLQLVSSAGGA